MKEILLALLHLAVMTARLCRPGGVREVIAENLILKQQLIVLRRARRRAPNLAQRDRMICALGSLFLSPGRMRKVAISVRPSTLLAFHQASVRRKYRRLFSSSPGPKKPGPKGPSEALIKAIVELKSRNPRFGSPRIARIISRTFVERLIGTIRREFLDQVAFWNGRDLERKLADFQAYYNAARSHAGIGRRHAVDLRR